MMKQKKKKTFTTVKPQALRPSSCLSPRTFGHLSRLSPLGGFRPAEPLQLSHVISSAILRMILDSEDDGIEYDFRWKKDEF